MTDNLSIWNAVSKTNPKYTKHVNQRGGFTAVNANAQIMAATEQFGPIGSGWGYDALPPIFSDGLIIVPVTLWHGERGNTFGPEYGCAELVSDKGRKDSDAPKKATTDAITKLLSRLGFNADVFLGRYDDQKYVDQVTQEFAEKERESVPRMADNQVAELANLATGAKMNLSVFVSKFNEGGNSASSINDLPATEFKPIKAVLLGRIEKLAKKENT